MKAVIIEEHGGPEVLKYVEDYPKPEIKDGEVLVRVRATSLNRVDSVIRKGYPGLTMKFPHIMGGDVVGEVAEVSSNSQFKVGERIMATPMLTGERNPEQVSGFNLPEQSHLSHEWKFFGMQTQGSYAEYIAVPEESLITIPDGLSYEDATGLGVAGLTAYHAVVGVGKLQKDEVFLIWGGSGGLGSIAIQIAKNLGAKVITTVGSEEKNELIKSLGADYVFNHNTDDVAAEVRKLYPFGVDLVVDYVGPKTFQSSHDLLKRGGRMVLCGILTGREANLSIHMTYFRHLSIHGVFLGTKDELKALIQLASEGKVKTLVSKTYELSEIQEAHKDLDSSNYTGKIVIRI